jgi:hypothetical protein
MAVAQSTAPGTITTGKVTVAMVAIWGFFYNGPSAPSLIWAYCSRSSRLCRRCDVPRGYRTCQLSSPCVDGRIGNVYSVRFRMADQFLHAVLHQPW